MAYTYVSQEFADSRLLKRAKEEVQAKHDTLCRIYNGTPILELLLQDLLGPIVTELGVTTNRSMLSVGERTLSPLEWKAFVHTLLHLCAYNLSPTRYFNRPEMYPGPKQSAVA